MADQRRDPVLRGAMIVSALSACAATVHEVVWSRLVGRVVGNTTWGVGLTLALLMAGMGVGSVLVRRVLRRSVDARRWYVATELVLGASAVVASLAMLHTGSPSALLGDRAPALGLLLDALYAVGVAALPALAMGATYPLLLAGVLARDADARAPVTGLYAAGLAGGVAGVLGAAVWLVPRLGADLAACVAAGLNLASAIGALAVLDRARGTTSLPARRRVPRPTRRDALIAFGAAGFFGVGAQVVWNRIIVPYAGVSAFSFAAIVAAYVGAQGLGMALARRARPDRLATVAVVALGWAAPVALLSLAWISNLAELIPSREGSAFGWVVACAIAASITVGPTALLLGVAQAGALARLEGAGEESAIAAATVSGLGTIFSALGAMLVALVLFPLLGPRAALLALAIPAWLALVMTPGQVRRQALVALAASILLVAVRVGPSDFLGREFDDARVLAVDHGVQDTAAVVVADLPVEPRIRHLVANGVSYSGDSLFAQRYMRLLGHLPALAAKRTDRALVVCVGTGTTTDALLRYPFSRVVAVDINPGLARLLAFFRHVSPRVAARPRALELVVDDGDRFLRRTRRTFDVITLEPPPPRAPGGSSLYTRELYEAARERLTDGGVLAQWLPLHGLSAAELASIAQTFIEVFPRSTLHLAERNEAILLGVHGASDAPLRETAARARGRRAQGDVRRDLAEIGFARADLDPLRDTFVASMPALRELGGAEPIRAAWPGPELAPLVPRSASRWGAARADAWAERMTTARARSGGGARAEATSAEALLPAVAPFIRMREGRARAGDREAIERALVALLRRDPEDPYFQHVFGFGPLLERRLARVSARDLDAREAARVRNLIARQRQWAAEL